MSGLPLLRPVVSPPTSHRLRILRLAAVLTTGRRTVSHRRRTVRDPTSGHGSSSHRGLSQRPWSPWALARTLLTSLLDRVVPPGPVRRAGDETVTEHPGPAGCGQGRPREGGRAPHRETADRWGHQGVVRALLVKWPFTARPWARPLWVALSRPPARDRRQGRRQKTPAPRARRRLARLRRRCPPPHCLVGGDSGYGARETARLGRQHRRSRTLVREVDGAAALSAPPPPRPRRPSGRPRLKGPKRAAPHAALAHTATRLSRTVAWSGGARRASEVITGTGPWSRRGEARVAVRWLDVHAGPGTHRDEDGFTTDIAMQPPQIVECDTHRWSIDTTSPAGREPLQLESTTG
jgi:hypothetical protein